MSGNFVRGKYDFRSSDDQTTSDLSSSEDKPSFPFQPTPSGNLKVVPQQVVYESKQLSIVAADPQRTKVNIKPDSRNPIKDMSGDRTTFPAELFSKMPARTSGQDVFDHNRGDHRDTCTVAQLQHEITLSKMGFSQGPPIEWTKVQLPPKTDLHDLIHYQIVNGVNPDVTVVVGDKAFRCHLLVLQCYSALFVERPTARMEVEEAMVTSNAFSSIYDWMLHLGKDSYSLLRRDNILEIFVASQYFKIKELEEQCWAFIDNEELFSEDKAFLLYLDARAAGVGAVMELMVPRVQRFFLTLVSSRDFLEMSEPEVCVFLRSNYICIHCEMEVFMSAVRWLMYDWENRKESLVEVMKWVRFGLIPPWQLVDIRRNPDNQEFLLITRNQEVSRMIEDGLAYAIIKYWYGHDNNEYSHWCENLGLTEPAERNWAGTNKINDQKKYNTYQEFLTDLVKYRQMHLLSNKAQEKRRDSKDSLFSEMENARKLQRNSELILPQQRH
ncbi:uncharacterized protein LOC129003912 [Macrosteles quadrilineatus]|uniref:uncharacterized protein LOC129003912 n=1 Tax=Macrosteles quadrilineatus TaxID=74068 RepID=UPI0023E232F0|nr:uncharacterized protein LOC129003912 [Macrosteles quadrilineatus]